MNAIYVMNVDGSDQRRLSEESMKFAWFPSWSPDGSRIVFAAAPNGRDGKIVMMNADGSQPQVILSNYVVHHFSWSPDGTRIVFDGWYGERLGIFVMNADGSDLQELRTAGSGFGVDWRPASNAATAQIAFSSMRDGNWEIYLMDTDGGNLQRLTDHPAMDAWPTWSPDGTQIAFTSERDSGMAIYVMNADGSEVRRLTDNSLPGFWPDWSPNGSQIAFVSPQYGDQAIYVINADGSDPRRVAEAPNAEALPDFPTWSPDGERIVYTMFESGDRDGLWIVNADGSDLYRLTDMSGVEPIWSPDGLQIFFTALHDWNFYVVDVPADPTTGGSEPRRFARNVISPSWSPDGSQMTFVTWRGNNADIYVMDNDGGNWRQLTNDPAEDNYPAWRPTRNDTAQLVPQTQSGNGAPIAFISDRDGYGNGEIYVMNADGSDQTRLTFDPQWNGTPDWSPDGTLIAFYQHRTNNIWNIYVMDADGSHLRMLTDNEGRDSSPVWSPDGSQIAFTSEISNQPSPQIRAVNRDIYVMNSDGSDRRKLTFDESDDFGNSWSPDGSQITFCSNRDGNFEIYIMDADGSNIRRLTNDPADDYAPAWSPDGGHIVFWSNRDGGSEIYLMNVDGSSLQNLTNNEAEDWFPAWSADGAQIVFSSDRDGNMDIYVMNADGSSVRRLTDSRGIDFEAAWRP